MFKKNFFLLGLAFVLILLLPLFSTFLKAQSNSELIKLFEMNKCISDKQIPCRWVSDLGGSYGYPLFNYYAPLPYYFGEVIYLLTNNLAFAIWAMFATGLIGTYIFTYIFAFKFLKKSVILLPAIFYTIATFLILLFLPNTLMGLIWDLMFFPLVLLSITMLSQKNTMQNILVFIISLTLLVLSSNYFFLSLIFIFLWIIYQYVQSKNTIFIPACFICLISSFLLSAFYLFPAVAERNLVHSLFTFDYLPIFVKERPQTVVNSKYQILTGESKISDFEQGSNWFKFRTETKTHTIIRISQYYFPEWKIKVDGSETNVEYANNGLGLMTIILGKGNHLVYGKLFDTPIRLISNILSAVSFFIFLLLLTLQLKKVRGWIAYYRKRID